MRRWGWLLILGLLWCPAAFSQNLRLLIVPFANKGAASDDWLAAGIENALVADSGRMKGLAVVSRRERKKALDDLGQELSAAPVADRPLILGREVKAALVLSGEYTVTSGEVTLKARLAAGAQATLVGEIEIQRSLEHVADVEDEIIISLFTAGHAAGALPLKLPVPTGKEIQAIQARPKTRAAYEVVARELALSEPVPQEFLDIEEAVFANLNRERVKKGQAPFIYRQKLAFLGRSHSRNMATYKFFDFTDQDGLNLEARKQKLAPELFGELGQLIAFNYGGSPAELADKFVRQWMGSASAAQVLNPDYGDVGVGVFRGDEPGLRYYCTVVPASLLAELVWGAPGKIAAWTETEFRFRFLGAFPRDELSIIIRFPDKTARVFRKNGSYTEGFGFFAPQKWEGDFFTIIFPGDKGRGAHLLQAARGDSFSPAGLSFTVE